jgi:integrase
LISFFFPGPLWPGFFLPQRFTLGLSLCCKGKETKSEKGRRRIELSKFTLAVLKEHRKLMLAEGRGNASVFCDTNGGYLRRTNIFKYSFKPIIERANQWAKDEAKRHGITPVLLPTIRFHDLRHTCATLLLLADVNAKIVSERLGHASIELTLNTYSRVLPTMQKRAAEKMDSLFEGLANLKAED